MARRRRRHGSPLRHVPPVPRNVPDRHDLLGRLPCRNLHQRSRRLGIGRQDVQQRTRQQRNKRHQLGIELHDDQQRQPHPAPRAGNRVLGRKPKEPHPGQRPFRARLHLLQHRPCMGRRTAASGGFRVERQRPATFAQRRGADLRTGRPRHRRCAPPDARIGRRLHHRHAQRRPDAQGRLQSLALPDPRRRRRRTHGST